MGFYDEFYRYYDHIFPHSQEKEEFLLEQFSSLPDEASLLDMGCGTGTYSIALQKKGFDVVGIDLEEEMIDRSREKTARENMELEPRFKILDMRDLDVLYSPGSFSGAYSLGNVLVHLTDEDNIRAVLEKLNRILLTPGRIVIQIVNYDRILSRGVTELPTISAEDQGVEFERRYRYDEENNIIKFRTKLTVENPEDEEPRSIRGPNIISGGDQHERVFTNTIDLYPLQSSEVEDMLSAAGFQEIEFYGSFQCEEFQPDESFPLIITAWKK